MCSITLAFVSQPRNDRKTHPNDSTNGASLIIEQRRTRSQQRHDLARLEGKGKDWQREKPGEPLGVFLAASLLNGVTPSPQAPTGGKP